MGCCSSKKSESDDKVKVVKKEEEAEEEPEPERIKIPKVYVNGIAASELGDDDHLKGNSIVESDSDNNNNNADQIGWWKLLFVSLVSLW